MRKMDEMDRAIQLRSEEWGYKTALFGLCGWTVFNIYQSITKGIELEMLPCLILQLAIKQKMIDGDEEFKEPNKLVQGVILMVVILIVVLAIGIYCFQKD